jgi:hypothetical protein
MKAVIALTVLTATLSWSAPAALAAPADDRVARITCLMSPAEIEATGMRNLTPEQLEALSAWLETYRLAAQRLALVEYIDGDAVKEAAVQSRLLGVFDSREDDAVFRLENGQIWQQTSPSSADHYARHPRETNSAAPHRLRVEGLAGEIAVRRLQ